MHESLHNSPLNPPQAGEGDPFPSTCAIIPILRQSPDVVFVR